MFKEWWRVTSDQWQQQFICSIFSLPQRLEELSFVLRARVKGTWPVSVTTGIHHSALLVRNFLSLSTLCPLVCTRWPLSLRRWERERAHLCHHNARVWKQLLPQPCVLKVEEAQTSPFFTSIFHSLSISSEHLNQSLPPHPRPALRKFLVILQILAPMYFLWGALPAPQGQAGFPYTW